MFVDMVFRGFLKTIFSFYLDFAQFWAVFCANLGFSIDFAQYWAVFCANLGDLREFVQLEGVFCAKGGCLGIWKLVN